MSKKHIFDGVEGTLKSHCKRLGITYSTIMARIGRGWTAERALYTPIQKQEAPCYITGTKVCSVCKETKPLDSFTLLKRRTGRERQPACKACDRTRCRKARLDSRMLLLVHYGGDPPKCTICGEHRIAVLDLDHIHGGGVTERKMYNNSDAMFRRLKKQGFPPRFRVLCRNCNWIEHLKLHKIGEYYE